MLTLFGITGGMTVIWYTAQFYALFFVQSAMHVDYKTSCTIFAVGLIIGTPLMVVCGALSDRIGRKPIMMMGLLLGSLTLVPAFHALAYFTNPALGDFTARNPITIAGDGCTFSLFAKPTSDCDKARNFYTREDCLLSLCPGQSAGPSSRPSEKRSSLASTRRVTGRHSKLKASMGRRQT